MTGVLPRQNARLGRSRNDNFQGKKTASGEVYNKNGLTAAHKKLAYRTKVKVRNVENGKSVIVTVNDRMDTSSPAVIDVTRQAAERLDFVKSGKAKVKLEVVK
jgi:rare lipoprotein A